MITCNIKGGLGNQLFQVAFAYATGRKTGRECILLSNQFDGALQGRSVVHYYDTIFRRIKKCIPYFAQTYRVDEQMFAYYPIQEQIGTLSVPEPSLIMADGYFQSELYFKGYKEDLKQLLLPDEGVLQYLQCKTDLYLKYTELFGKHNYCYIGVRRGDYLKYAHIHNPCDVSYYKNAMSQMPADKYYIASDDIEWCKENLKGDNIVYFDISDDYLQLLIATLFNKYIISNSSFHWWASYLSKAQEPLIIAPDKWIKIDRPNDTCETVYRPEMVILSRT